MRRGSRYLAVLCWLLIDLTAQQALAAGTPASITLTATNGTNFGNIGDVVQTSPPGTGTFTIAPSGTITSDNGLTRIHGLSSVSPPIGYTVTCVDGTGSGNRCGSGSGNISSVQVTVTTTGPSGSANDVNPKVSVTVGAGATSCGTPTTTSSTASFTCTGVKSLTGQNTSEVVATFTVGLDVKVTSDTPSGTQTLGYSIQTTP